MRAGLLLLGLAGCDEIIGLQRPPEVDAPAAGHDEDKDGVADATDTCPGIKNNQLADADGDGVGDACDPHPDRSDRILAFYAFEGAEPAWQLRNGNWSYGNDQLVYRGSTTYELAYAKAGPTLMPPYVVEIRYHISRMVVGSEISISAAYGTSPNGLFCTFKRDVVDELHAYRPGDDRVTPTGMLDLGATFQMRATVETGDINCVLESGAPARVAASTDLDMPYTGTIGIEGRDADATFDYLVIYGPAR